jgi:hypothetical protein
MRSLTHGISAETERTSISADIEEEFLTEERVGELRARCSRPPTNAVTRAPPRFGD